MSTKAQLQAVIDGYREELAVARLQIDSLESDLAETDGLNGAILLKGIEQATEIDRLDSEAERQAERIIELETELDRSSRDQCMTVSKAPEPAITFQGQMAILAVAEMIENRAAHMVLKVGSDAGEYARLMEEAHWLRSEVGMVDPAVAKGATELYEGLSTAF